MASTSRYPVEDSFKRNSTKNDCHGVLFTTKPPCNTCHYLQGIPCLLCTLEKNHVKFFDSFFSCIFGRLQRVCITRPQRVRLTDTPSLPRPRDGGGGWIWHVYYLLGPHFLRKRRAAVHEGGVATSLANYNSINEFALRTNLRTPRNVALISDAQHVRVGEREREKETEKESREWKNKIKLMCRKAEENPREQRQ